MNLKREAGLAMISICSIVLLLWTVDASAQPTLNEVLSANATGILDEDGDREDWIEVHNAGPELLDLAGYHLSDDSLEPNKWTFPELILQAGQSSLVFASDKNRHGHYAPHWETIVDWGDTLAYQADFTEAASQWREPGYDDDAWPRGPSGFGYGDDDDATELPTCISCFVRHDFLVTDLDEIISYMLHVDFDDAFVAYLNGVEIARMNIDVAGDPPPAWNEYADLSHEARIFQGLLPEAFFNFRPDTLLVEGLNTFAVQVHNTYGSSDMSCIPFLTLGLKNAPPDARGIPDLLAGDFTAMHTNFKLDNAGETLILSSPEEMIIDLIYTGELHSDISLGRQPDGGASWFLFAEPTPCAPNDSEPLQGYVDPPIFSNAPGFYSGSASFTLSCPTPGAEIRFTLEGWLPDENATLYEGEVLVEATSIIRARAFLPGRVPSEVITQTYLIDEAFAMPVMSLTSDPDNLWDDDIGIYTIGHGDPYSPYEGANFWNDWERPVHLEFFTEDGSLGFKADAGFKIFGGASRALPQKSFRVIMRSSYGQSPLAYQLFEDLDIMEFKQFLLRNSGQDWSMTHIRDGVMHRMVEDCNLDLQAFRPASIFLNGEYWGILNIRERQNESYLNQHYGVDEDSLDILRWRTTVLAGDNQDYIELTDFIRYHPMSDQEDYDYVTQYWDIDNFLEYNAMNIYLCNWDWPGSNMKYWRSTQDCDYDKWRYLVFDTDAGMAWNNNDVSWNCLEKAVDFWDYVRYPFRPLLDNPGFAQDFINTMADRMNSNFKPSRMHQIVDETAAMSEAEIGRHMLRWGWTYADWQNEMGQLHDFIDERPVYAKQHLMDYFGLPDTLTLSLDIDPPGTGRIRLTAIEVEGPWSGMYFQGNPIKLTAVGNPGYTFRDWSDPGAGGEFSIEISPTGDYEIIAMFREAPDVMISEINYNSADAFNPGDWIELHNPRDHEVDLSAFHFKDEDDLHDFVFPAQTLIGALGYLVLCEDAAVFATFFPDAGPLVDGLAFGLSGDGELLRLYDDYLNLVDQVVYDDVYPWPSAPDGFGPTLELRAPWLDNALAQNWAASSAAHGTPGEQNSVHGVSVSESDAVPAQLLLNAAWPNPFNPRTTFRFGLPAKGDALLTVHDVRGRLVDTLVRRDLPAGWHKIVWEPRRLASGLYFCRLEADGVSRTTKVLLLK